MRLAALTVFSLVVLVGCCYVSFLVGRESAKPSLTKALVGQFASGPIVDLLTGALHDAKVVVDKVRLDVCISDAEKLEAANVDLAQRLGTFESRLRSAQQSNTEIRENLRATHEVTKELSEKLYSTTCEEWALTPVCPDLRGTLRFVVPPNE